MDLADVILRAFPQLGGILTNIADVLLKATPNFGGLSPMMILSGFLLIGYIGHSLYSEGG